MPTQQITGGEKLTTQGLPHDIPTRDLGQDAIFIGKPGYLESECEKCYEIGYS